MLELNISNNAQNFLENLQVPKLCWQIMKKVFSLRKNPTPSDYKHLSGHPGCFRVDSGEYRIVYKTTDTIINIILIGKRNDDEVYRQLNRKIG